MKLTDKDILLVKLAVSILIVFFMVRFLIMPGIGRYQENRIEGKELEDRVEEIQTAVDSIPVLEQTIAEQRKELDKVSEVYYGRLENRQIDELLTGIAINAGLFPVSLSIGEAQPVIPAPYIYETLLEDTKENAKETSSQTAEGSEQDLEREMDLSEDTDSGNGEDAASGDEAEAVAEIVEEGGF